MSWTLNSALDDPDVKLVSRDDLFGAYSFRVGSLDTIVDARLIRSPAGEETRYERSHDIHTPLQAGPYQQGRPYWDDPGYALHQAIESITSYYRLAVKAGHSPDESWLKTNKYF